MIILKVKKVLDGLINWVIQDYVDSTNKNDSWLYEAFGKSQLPNFKSYDQLVGILMRTEKDPRKVETRLLFDPSRAQSPTIHIHMPQEEPFGGNLVGMNTREDVLWERGSNFSYVYEKKFSTNYDIIVTSTSQTEVLLLYELLKKLFIAGVDTINQNFLNFNFSGKELLYDSTLMPDIYYRAFSIRIEEEVNAPAIISKKNSGTSIEAKGFFVGYDSPKYTIEIENDGGGTVLGDGEYDIGDLVTLLATPDDGYEFTGWYENDVLISSEMEYSFNMTFANRLFVSIFTIV